MPPRRAEKSDSQMSVWHTSFRFSSSATAAADPGKDGEVIGDGVYLGVDGVLHQCFPLQE